MKAHIVDVRKFAVHDGPGIRTTFFLKGCPLHCIWCHNPESISPRSEIGLVEKRCSGCGRCAAFCPNHRFTAAGHEIDRANCSGCGRCAGECVSGALTWYGRPMEAEEAEALALEDLCFYETSGGGCTLSGGEPLLQPEFCAELFRRLGKRGVHRALDSCGSVPPGAFETIAPYTDLFLYDLKQMDPELHRKYTGASNERILSNLRLLARLGKPVEIRMPVVPGCNDSRENFEAAGEFLSGLGNITAVRLLAYHSYARSKYRAVGRPDTMPRTESPSPARLLELAEILRRRGLAVVF